MNCRVWGLPPYRAAVVHGGPGAAGEMGGVARRLSPAGGVLEPFQTALSVDGQAGELAGVLSQYAAPPVALIGFSWGAWLALLLASRRPDLAARLILVSCPPLEERYVSAIEETRAARLTPEEAQEFRALAGSCVGEGGEDERLARLGFLAHKADRYSPLEPEPEPVVIDGGIYNRVWPEAAGMRRSGALLDAAARVRCPVFAVHGDFDPSPAEGVIEPLAARLPGFRWLVLEKCGHTPWIERYAQQAFYAALAQELASGT